MRISDWSSDVCSSDLHFEHVADRCADGLLRVALDYRVPVANGVLAVDEQDDAERRAGGRHGNKGEECALVALELSSLLGKLPCAGPTAAGSESPPQRVRAHYAARSSRGPPSRSPSRRRRKRPATAPKT